MDRFGFLVFWLQGEYEFPDICRESQPPFPTACFLIVRERQLANFVPEQG